MAKITVVYKGYTGPECRTADPICPVFLPTNSYADNATETIANSPYNTNVPGMGEFDLKSFIAKLCLPFPGAMKYLNMALVGNNVEFEVTDYKEILFFQQLAAELGSEWEITGPWTETEADTGEGNDEE